jgi:N-acetylmuramate 1-kinase
MTAIEPSIASPVAWPNAQRHADFERWLAPLVSAHGLRTLSLRPASADASFRRYLRVDRDDGSSLIVMDAPPPQEDVRPFVQVARLIEAAGLHGPEVLANDNERGFLLLSDLGQTLYLDALREASAAQADALMRDAIRALVQWQLQLPSGVLPPYSDALLERDLALFPEWCVQREYGVAWTAAQLARRLPTTRGQRAGAAARGRAPRLDAAQPDGRRPEPGDPGFPGRGLGADRL